MTNRYTLINVTYTKSLPTSNAYRDRVCHLARPLSLSRRFWQLHFGDNFCVGGGGRGGSCTAWHVWYAENKLPPSSRRWKCTYTYTRNRSAVRYRGVENDQVRRAWIRIRRSMVIDASFKSAARRAHFRTVWMCVCVEVEGGNWKRRVERIFLQELLE